MMEELKPCPFCGGEADIDKYGWGWNVRCLDPKCHFHIVPMPAHETEKEAIEAWNTRYESTCTNTYDGREFECSECGVQWHLLSRADVFDEWKHVVNPAFCPNCGAKVVES